MYQLQMLTQVQISNLNNLNNLNRLLSPSKIEGVIKIFSTKKKKPRVRHFLYRLLLDFQIIGNGNILQIIQQRWEKNNKICNTAQLIF